MRRWLAIAASCAALSGLARAEDLADCNGAAFRAAIGADAAFKCAELSRDSYTANGQTFTVRAIRDGSTDPQFVAQHAEETADAMLSALSVFDDLSAQFGFEFGHVSVLMIDPNRTIGDMKGEKISGVFADANARSFPRECIVRMNIPLNDKSGLDALRNTAAHELFHCIQGWSYPAATQLGGSEQWWVEGSAEFFASQVQIDTARMETLGSAFIGEIEKTPLTQTPYRSVVFFAWLWSQGPDKMAAFFKGLATSPGETLQMDTTVDSIGETTLQLFAQALADGTIAMPSGYTFPALPEQVETTAIDDDQKQIELPLKRFTLMRHALHFANGTYNSWSNPTIYKREQSGGPWSELDPMEKIEGESCKDIRMLLTAHFATASYADKMSIVAMRAKECLDCVKMPKVDQCVVGKWRMSNEALLTYLQATNGQPQSTNFSGVGGTAILVFDKNGAAQFVVEGLKIGAEVRMAEGSDDQAIINVEANGIDSGEWGTDEGGAMNYCAKQASIGFRIRVELPNGYTHESEQDGMLEDSIWTYSCSGDELLLRYTGPNVLPDGVAPRWQLTRMP
ncbi:MAG: hypothetical protein QM698_14080 [Micropepsaceae bacterium]